MVPPVPTPATSTSTAPSVSFQISGPVVFSWIAGLAGFSNCCSSRYSPGLEAAISLALSWLNAYEAQAEQGKEENVHGVICSTYQLEGYTDALEKAGLLSREALFRLRARVFAGHQAAIDAIAEKYQLQEVEVKTIFSPSWERITSGSKLH